MSNNKVKTKSKNTKTKVKGPNYQNLKKTKERIINRHKLLKSI